MCGIVGFYSKGSPTFNQWKYMKTALIFDSVRGEHATGIAGVNQANQSWSIAKRALNGFDFICTDLFDKFEEDKHNYNIFIGHNRFATRGDARKDKNAHPFYVGAQYDTGKSDKQFKEEIILVHNGGVDGFHSLSGKGFHHEVDSAHITAGMSEFGERETLEKLDGWFVLVWANLTKKTFNMARSDCRDIALFFSEDKKDMYFGSEGPMVKCILDRENIKVQNKEFSFKEYEWFIWDMADKDFSKARREVIKKYQRPTTIITNPSHPYSRQNNKPFDDWDRRRSETASRGAYTEIGNEMVWHGTGYRKYEDVGIVIKGFELYHPEQKDRLGAVLAETYDEIPRNVKVHSVTEANYEELFSHEAVKDYVPAETSNVHVTGTKEKVLICKVEIEDLKRIIKNYKDAIPTIIPPKKVLGHNPLKEAIGRQLSLPKVNPPDIRYPGPNKEMISAEEWRKFAEDGCAKCSSPIKFERFNKLAWVGEYTNQLCCHECSDQYLNPDKSNPQPAAKAA